MSKAMLALISAVVLLACAPSENAAASSNDVAASVAAAMAPRQQMRGMILQTLGRTTTGAIIVEQLGQQKANSLFEVETDKVVARYGDEWTENLAASYRETLTPAELGTAQRAIAERNQAAMMPLMMRVGPVMQAKSTPLLQKAAAEALTNAFGQIEKGPSK